MFETILSFIEIVSEVRVLVSFAIGIFVTVIGTILFGSKYKQRIAGLEARPDVQPTNTINITVNGEKPTTAPSGTIGSNQGGVVTFGTIHGPIRVRLYNDQYTQQDILRWLHDNRLLTELGISGHQ